jgi:capsular exopolysaccharide synthesis family protein
LFREKTKLVVFAMVGAVVGILLTVPRQPVYQARTSLDIQSLNENFLNMRAVDPSGAAGTYSAESNLQTHIRLLQSDELIRRVVTKLKSAPEKRLPRRDLMSAVLGKLGREVPSADRAELIETAAQHIKVKPIGFTRLIQIDCQSTDPGIAAEFCNTLSHEYASQDFEIRADVAQNTKEWLTRQLADVRTDLERKEARVLNYAKDNRILFNQETDTVNQEKLKQTQLELSKATADRVAKQSAAEMLRSANPDTLPSVLDSGPLKLYEERLNDLLRQRAELTSSLTAGHPKVAKVQAQIDQMVSSIKTEKANILDRVRNEYASAAAREDILARSYKQQEAVVAAEVAKQAQYKLLRQEAESERVIYESLLQRVREAGLVSLMRASPVRVVDPAAVPRSPISPQRASLAGVGGIIGFLFGIGLVFWQERSSPRMQAPGELQSKFNARELGVIPSSSVDRLGSSQNGLELVTYSNSRSLLAESYRATMNSLLFNYFARARAGVIVVSSPGVAEGKTSLSCNLGIALAETRRRVLLIDADMRRPRLHHIFDLPNDRGLSDLLSDEVDMDQLPVDLLAVPTSVPNLSVIPSGAKRGSNIAALLHGDGLERLLKRLRREFDVIVVDTPPLMHVSDARIIGWQADGMILVFRSNVTTLEAAKSVQKRLDQDGIRVIGTVLNDYHPMYGSEYRKYKTYYAQNA